MTNQTLGEILYAGVSTVPVYTPWGEVVTDRPMSATPVRPSGATRSSPKRCQASSAKRCQRGSAKRCQASSEAEI